MSYKLMAGLAVAAASVTATGVVQAEEAVPVSTETNITHVETSAQPEVTQAQVDDAKASFDQANQAMFVQEAAVQEAQVAKDQAQLAVVEASLAVTESQKLADQANPESITQAQEAVTKATQDVVSAEKAVEKEAEKVEPARQAVLDQEAVVKDNQAKVSDAEKEVSQAQEAVELVKASMDQNSTQVDLTRAQEEVTVKTAKVAEAQTALEQSQKADALLEERSAQAQETFSQRASEVQQAEFLLNKILVGMAKEAVSTSFEDHAYYNQRDAIWAAYYGNGSFAATGCVPAVLAMVFTELDRRGITPKQVADYLYNNTEYFNKNFSGTSAHGIVSASEHFGFVPTQLASQSAIVEALQAGHHVVGAVQNNKFSPWGGGYSHEVVMKGYSNGKTYIYDPYNRANIGWYPVASLWAEQSQDRDDRALGAPFFKITTQKMADLEAQKIQATKAVQSANRQLTEAKQEVVTYLAGSKQVPRAEEDLRQATLELKTAKENLVKTQEVVRLADQELDEKETELKKAQSDLALKEASLEDAKADLIASQAKLANLQSVLTEAEKSVAQAEQALVQAKQDLIQKEANLSGLEQSSENLAKAKEKLSAIKLDLEQKNLALEQAKSELEPMKSAMFEAESKYQALMTGYRAMLEEKQAEQLLMDYQSIVSSGGQVVPVIDETGKVTSYVNGKSSKDATSSLVNVSTKLMSGEHQVKESSNDEALPSTGETASNLGMAGIGMMSILGLVQLKRKKSKTI